MGFQKEGRKKARDMQQAQTTDPHHSGHHPHPHFLSCKSVRLKHPFTSPRDPPSARPNQRRIPECFFLSPQFRSPKHARLPGSFCNPAAGVWGTGGYISATYCTHGAIGSMHACICICICITLGLVAGRGMHDLKTLSGPICVAYMIQQDRYIGTE